MSTLLAIVGIFWGLLAGYLLLRGIDSLLGLLFCIHGLFARRWKILADKNATGLVRPRQILKLALRLACYAALCVLLLEVGNGFLQREFHFYYGDIPGALFVAGGGMVIFSRILTSWRRLKLVWRLTHEFDFAARRERTRMLKG